MVYSLYHNKKDLQMIIETWSNGKNWAKDKKEVTNGVFYWNDYHFLSEDRKALREFAKELKKQWHIEMIEYLDRLEKLKIKTKY